MGVNFDPNQLATSAQQLGGTGGVGGGASLQPDPLSAADRSFLGYGRPDLGQPLDWFTATGTPGGMNTGGQGPGWAGQSAAPQPLYGPPVSGATPQLLQGKGGGGASGSGLV